MGQDACARVHQVQKSFRIIDVRGLLTQELPCPECTTRPQYVP